MNDRYGILVTITKAQCTYEHYKGQEEWFKSFETNKRVKI
jgi:hypothetical protein